MPVLLSEAIQTLLSGNALSWTKFGDFKGGEIQLATAAARRLAHFLLSCDQNKVEDAKEELFEGLIAAWRNTSFDPAATAKATTAIAGNGTWRLVRLESAGFGGLNLVDGPNFLLALDGENWCLEGQNGSGKTSIASAIIWALTGCRCRDQDGVMLDDGRRVPVFNDSGAQIGDWPPTVSYPASPRKLSGVAETWVRLSFQNETGHTAEAYRRLVAIPSGEPKFDVKVDPVLQSAPQLAAVANGNSLARSYEKAKSEGDDAQGHRYVFEVRTYCEDLLKIMLRSEGPDVCDLSLDSLANLMKKLREASVAPFNRPSFEKLLNTIAGGGGAKPMKIINDSHHKFDGTIGVAQATDVKIFWEKTLQTQIHTCFKVYAEYEAYSGEPRLFPWMDNVIPLPLGNAAELKKLKLVQTGIAAAAKSDGRAGDGLITLEELAQSAKITLHNHDAYQLAAGTLEPVATVGDIVIVSNYAKVHSRNLVVTAFGDQLLARRYNETEIHPHIAVLSGQAVDPHALVQPVIAPLERLAPRKIVGTLFASSRLSTPPKDENAEFMALSNFTIVNELLDDAKLFKVSGRSAEPIALDGQFIMTQPVVMTSSSLREMDGRLIIAVDDGGARYFKRLRRHGAIVVLESLNPDGTTPAEVLSLEGALNLPRLTGMLEVVGVLFELPN